MTLLITLTNLTLHLYLLFTGTCQVIYKCKSRSRSRSRSRRPVEDSCSYNLQVMSLLVISPVLSVMNIAIISEVINSKVSNSIAVQIKATKQSK